MRFLFMGQACAVTVLYASVSAGTASAQPLVASDGYVYAARPVTDFIHIIIRPDAVRVPAEGNVEVIEQADGLVVVDAGGTPIGGQRIAREIRRISPKPVKFLVYTHWHGDHNLGASAFRAAYPGVRIISTQKTWENMTGEPMQYVATMSARYRAGPEALAKLLQDTTIIGDRRTRLQQLQIDASSIADAYEGAKAVPADLTFESRVDLPDLRAPVQVLFLGRANTDGDAIVWVPKQKVLITGDVVVSPYPFGTGSYPEDWVKVLRRLETFDFEYLVPGHGSVQTNRQYLESMIALVEEIRSQVAPLAKAGVSLEDIHKRVNFDKQYALFAGDSSWIRDVFRKNFMDPMVTSAFKEARGEAISQNP